MGILYRDERFRINFKNIVDQISNFTSVYNSV